MCVLTWSCTCFGLCDGPLMYLQNCQRLSVVKIAFQATLYFICKKGQGIWEDGKCYAIWETSKMRVCLRLRNNPSHCGWAYHNNTVVEVASEGGWSAGCREVDWSLESWEGNFALLCMGFASCVMLNLENFFLFLKMFCSLINCAFEILYMVG